MMPLKTRILLVVIAVAFAGSSLAINLKAYAIATGTTKPVATNTKSPKTAPSLKPRAELLLSPENEEVKRAMTEPKHHPTIALALGGGGIRGASHVGVLRVFEREHIPIDYIAGCSMGSIIGGLYASGMTCNELETILMDKSLQKAYAPGFVIQHLLGLALEPVIFAFRDRPYAGLFSGKQFLKFLDKRLPENAKVLEDTKIPFVAVVTNLCDGKSYKLAKGDLAQAILASSAFPPLVRPVYMNGNLYVDGGVRQNLPVVSAKQFHADITIAIDADEQLRPMPIKKFTSVKNVATRVTDIILDVADDYHSQKADLVIRPNLFGVPIMSRKTKDVVEAIKAGETAAEAALPAIRQAMETYKEKSSVAGK
jgi:NTE family protein